jgi:hypothetical protein
VKRILLSILFLIPFLSISQDLEWSDYQSISLGSDGYGRPRICLTQNNNPFIIWTKDNFPKTINASKWDGNSFSLPYSILPNGLDPAGGWQAPEIASSNDTVYVVFVSTSITNNAIFLIRSFNGGWNFSDTIRVSDNSNLNRYSLPNVTINNLGNPIVTYMEYELNWHNPKQIVKTSNDYGTTFGSAVNGSNLSPGEPCDCCRSDIISSGNDVYLLYRNNDVNIRDSYISFSSDGGLTFSSFVDIDFVSWNFPNCPSSTPRGIISGDSLIVARRSGAINSINEMYLSAVNRFDLQFTYNNVIHPLGFGLQDYPELSGNEDTIGLVWQDNRTGVLDCYFSHTVLGASSLSGSIKLTDSSSLGNQTDPDVSYSNRIFYFVYIDNTTHQIMYVTASLNEDISSINIQEIKKRYLLEIRNILGEISLPVSNTPLVYIYNDGTVEKKIILE